MVKTIGYKIEKVYLDEKGIAWVPAGTYVNPVPHITEEVSTEDGKPIKTVSSRFFVWAAMPTEEEAPKPVGTQGVVVKKGR